MLSQKPWGITDPGILANMTDWQIVNVLLRPCERKAAKKGYYWPVSNADSDSEEDGVFQSLGFKMIYFLHYRKFGIPDAEIEMMFRTEHPNYIGMESPVLPDVQPEDVGIVSEETSMSEVGHGN